MITPNDIQITSDLVYVGCGLSLCYNVNGELGGIIMSDTDVMTALVQTDIIRYANHSARMVMREGKVEFLDDYMRHALNTELAQKIVAYHLNNRRAKPVQIPIAK